MPKKDVKKDSNNNDLKKPKKSFRKSVSDVKKKIFSKNEADENLIKQKEMLLKEIKKFKDDENLNEIIKQNPKSINVTKFRNSLSLGRNETIDGLYKKITRSKSVSDLKKLKLDNWDKANGFALALKKYSDKQIYKLTDNKIITAYEKRMGENGETFKNILQGYEKKIKNFENDKKLIGIFENDGIKYYISQALIGHNNLYKALREGMEGKLSYDNAINDLDKMVFEFPDSLFENAGYKKLKEEFDARCRELETMKDFSKEAAKLEEERLKQFKNLMSELKEVANNKTKFNVIFKNLDKNKKKLEAIENCNNPEKREEDLKEVKENNDEMQEQVVEISKKDKTSKGKSRLKRFKEWSKKFSAKLKIKKKKSKIKK